jgi:hypothetical protein
MGLGDKGSRQVTRHDSHATLSVTMCHVPNQPVPRTIRLGRCVMQVLSAQRSALRLQALTPDLAPIRHNPSCNPWPTAADHHHTLYQNMVNEN